MKKLFPYILIFLIVVQLFTPFTVGVGIKNGLEVRSNKVEAVREVDYIFITVVSVPKNDGTNDREITDRIESSRFTTLSECETAQAIRKAADTLNERTGSCTEMTKGVSLVEKVEENLPPSGLPVCSIIPFKIGGCIAQGIYYLFFQTTSRVFGLAGKILDFTLMYSISDTSYRSQFVIEGWGLVRDFCNMFFIFILLYIAFGTILNLHSVKTKETIINVVIIGLLINFSLFATQVIIDASNILTRVFYNQNTIVIGTAQKDAQGNSLPVKNELGEFGEIKLSEAIVSKVDPQKLIMNAKAVNEIPKKTLVEGEEQETTKDGITTGSFIIIALLATAINIVGIIAFLSIGIIFITRVIGLWLAMILAPLAFFSYTIPALQNIEMIGWKRWWPETLKMAFLAPIFVFFMYLIVGFMDKGLGILNADGKTGLSFVVAIVVPFIFIMILLMKAKDIAKNMSGTTGQSITNGLSKVGGLALGAGIGGLAMAGRASIGRAGSAIANSDWAKRAESKGVFGARTLRTLSKSVGSASLDIRGIKIAGKDLGSSTGLEVGKAKEGGFEKIRVEKTIERKKRADELKVSEDSILKQNLNKVEADLQDLLRKNSHELEILDKRITAARQNAQDAASAAKADPTNVIKQAAAISTTNVLADLKGEKKAIKDASAFTTSAGIVIDHTGNVSTNGRSINQLEDHDIPDAHHHLEEENKNRAWNYAKTISSSTNKVLNFISSGGQHSSAGADEAAHKIRMDIKLDSGKKEH